MISIKLSSTQQQIFQALNAAIQEKQVYEERLAASMAIERGRFAEQIRGALTNSILTGEGLTPEGAWRLAPDCSGLIQVGTAPPTPPVPVEPSAAPVRGTPDEGDKKGDAQ